MIWLVSCGGGGTITPAAGDETPATTDQPTNTTTNADLNTWAQDQEFTEAPRTARGLPAIPLDASTASHAASDSSDKHTVLGKDALDYSLCEIDGDAMLINVDGAAAELEDGLPAWALYKVPDLAGLELLSLNGECLAGGYGQGYMVGVANYTTMDWEWLGPVSFAEFQFDLTGDSQYVTHLGNLYFLIACYGENTAKHLRSTVVLASGGDDDKLPGAPASLIASKGEFPDGVALTWLPGTGADTYEVWRKNAAFILAPDGAPGGDDADWELIGTTAGTSYFDDGAEVGLAYMYKARSANTTGYSEFSNVDEGWAKWEVPPPIYEGIHGYVFGGRLPADPDADPYPLPLEDALVRLLDPETEDIAYERLTNAEGFYQFAVGTVAAGEYLLTCELDGWYFPDTYWVVVPEGDHSQQYDFQGWLGAGGIPGDPPEGISGYVWCDSGINADGDPGLEPWIVPMSDVLIQAIRLDINTPDYVQYETYTDDEGFYQILELPTGNYGLRAVLDGWNFEPAYHYFDIIDNTVPTLSFDFWGWQGDRPRTDPETDPSENGICGTVMADGSQINAPLIIGDPAGYDPIAGVLITVTDMATDLIIWTGETDERGYYEYAGIPAGEFRVTAELNGWYFTPEEHVIVIPDFGDDTVMWMFLDFIGFAE
ncbi:carboxypeptidase regulatory-like domain-containing protein [bacterium]|nr:carboxypeptidase regulatory-like domain-containing protein [bacterium]